MQGVTMVFFEDVWSRNFLNVFSSPISVEEYLSGLVLSSIVTSAVGLAVMGGLAGPLFGFRFAVYGLWVLPSLLILFLFGIAMGIVGCALVLRLGPAAEWFIWPIPAFVSPFVGVFYPLAILPGWMQVVARGLPPSYVFEILRAVVAGARPSAGSLAAAAALALAYVALAGWVFRRVFRGAVRTGLIARYSAESVS
jgi:ABC-2 type transport system permease protein